MSIFVNYSSPERGVIRITTDEIRGFSMKVIQNPDKGSMFRSPSMISIPEKCFPEKFLDYFIFIPCIKFHA